MEATLSFRLVAALVQGLAWLLHWPMKLVADLPQAERIGIDRPGWFERVLMVVFPYREITKILPAITYREDVIEADRVLYLRRFFLTPSILPVRVFLHHICRSDDDRAPHDHPFDFTTCPLKGAYSENIDLRPDQSGKPADVRFVQAGERYDNPAEHVHRVDLVAPMWTLVVAGPSRRQWGFILKDGHWVFWRQYLNDFISTDAPEDVIR